MPPFERLNGYYFPATSRDLPEKAAGLFAELDAEEQARFWTELARLTGDWRKPACIQWSYMAAEMGDVGAAILLDMAACIRANIEARGRWRCVLCGGEWHGQEADHKCPSGSGRVP